MKKQIRFHRNKKSHLTARRKLARSSSLSRPKRVALRYLPLAILVVLNLAFAGIQPFTTSGSQRVLAYATSMSVSDLLSSTNQQRSANGVASLALNAKLNQAAQAKANDMVARNYWSHNTPDGQQPWVFIENAGYNFSRAGENLAYGFDTSAAAITGWMNSPPHRENLLDSSFKDVGFGFANSANYVGDGQQTVVVAMYGTLAGSAPAPSPTPPASTKPKKTAPPAVAPVATPPPTPPAATQPAPTPTPVPSETPKEPITSDAAASAGVASNNISRIQLLTNGAAAWSKLAVIASGVAVLGLWFMGHMRALRRALVAGEWYIMHHISVDLTVLAFGVLMFMLSRTAGIIR